MSVLTQNQEPRTKNREPLEAAGARNVSPARTAVAWLIGALLFGVALWIRLRMLDYQPLWLDEGRTWAIVTQSRMGTLLLGLLRPTEAYPLYHVLLKPVLRVLGDGEYALRLPSAVAGALAVPALLALGRELRGWMLGLSSSLLLLLAPWAIGQAQDAKAYSLVLLTAIMLALALARALRLGTRRAWLMFAVVALIAPFVHRLLVFSLLGCAVAWSVANISWERGGRPHISRLRMGVLIASILAGLALVAGIGIVQEVQRAGGQFASVGPLRGAWLTFGQWAVGQWPGVLRRLYLLPFGLLALLGAAGLVWNLWNGRHLRGAIVLLALGGFPALLFAVLLAWRDFYEPRYLTIVYPFWLLLLGWAVPELIAKTQTNAKDAKN